MSWPEFLVVIGTMLVFGLAVALNGQANERRWKREREAEEAGRRAAAE